MTAVLTHSNGALNCNYGRVLVLPTATHEGGQIRRCVHLLRPMPKVIAVSRAAVMRLNFQPRVMCSPQPIIAARHGSFLVLSADFVGPTSMRHPQEGMDAKDRDYRVRRHWRFKLHDSSRRDIMIATALSLGSRS